MAPFAKPETVLKRSEELIAVGQSSSALQALYDIFTNRRFKQTPLTSLQPIMIRFVDLCVDLRRGRTAKDGLVQYKNVSQNTDPGSIEVVIKHFISLAEAKVDEAQKMADQVNGITKDGDEEDGDVTKNIDVEDLEETETPESMLLGAVSVDGNKDRTDRELLTPWLKFLWEAFRTALDILRNNARLEGPYQQIAHQALKFCLRYQRKTEFRRLCDLLRTHLQNISRYSHHTHAINLTDPETLQRHLDTRFAQLNSAVSLELWQEAFRSIEDIHNLLTMTKKNPPPKMMVNYYSKLVKIFLVSENSLFHASSWNRYYSISRANGLIKSEEEHQKMANFVLLSALAVPVISEKAPGTGNMNKKNNDFLMGDEENEKKNGRLTALVGLNVTPTRNSLLREAMDRNLLKKVKPELKELYEILETQFHPLSICEKISPILTKIAKEDIEMEKYVKPLHSVILTRLFQQLSQVYDSVKLDKVMSLVSAFQAPYDYQINEIESFCLNAAKKGHLNIRVDHISKSITFKDDLFSSEIHPSSKSHSSTNKIGLEDDVVKLQSTPSELVRTQLTRLATSLEKVSTIIDPSLIETAKKNRQESLARAVSLVEKEHQNALARKEILIKRRNLLKALAEKKDKDDAETKEKNARLKQIEDAKRIEEEAKKRELDRVRKEMENVRIEEAKKMAASLKEKGGLKLTEEEYVNLDADKLVALQVSQLEKEKKELSERLRVIHRRMDHTERSYRKEELPLLKADYERQKATDLHTEKEARKTLLAVSKEKHQNDLILKERLKRIQPDYKELRKVLEGKRKEEFEGREKAALKKIEEEKEKRRNEFRQKKELERKKAEEAEKIRIEEEEMAKLREEEESRLAEQRRIESEAESAKEAEKLAEIKARQAKLDEVAKIQREREAEIEARRAAREKESLSSVPGRDSSPATGGGVWRRAAPSGAVAEAKAAPSPAQERERPSFIAGKPGGGGWREKEAAKKAALARGESAPPTSDSPTLAPATAPATANGTSSPSQAGSSSPAPIARQASGTAPAATPYRPAAAAGAAGGGWRAKEAARNASPAPAAVPASGAPNSETQPPAGSDGFTEVKRAPGGGAYRPPGRR